LSKRFVVEAENNSSLSPVELETIPLLSFPDAVKSLEGVIHKIDQYSFIALDFAQKQGPWPFGLTEDEVASINLYTREWTVNENSLYFILNQRLRDPNRRQVEPFLNYMKLLYTGLYKLQPFDCNEQRLWRAIRVPSDSPKYTKGQTVRWWSFGSCTLDMEQLVHFTDSGSPCIFTIKTNKAFQISPFSCFPNEGEVLIVPPVQLKVSNVATLKGVTIVEIVEDPTFPLYYLPCPKSDPQGENLLCVHSGSKVYLKHATTNKYLTSIERKGWCHGILSGKETQYILTQVEVSGDLKHGDKIRIAATWTPQWKDHSSYCYLYSSESRIAYHDKISDNEKQLWIVEKMKGTGKIVVGEEVYLKNFWWNEYLYCYNGSAHEFSVGTFEGKQSWIVEL